MERYKLTVKHSAAQRHKLNQAGHEVFLHIFEPLYLWSQSYGEVPRFKETND